MCERACPELLKVLAHIRHGGPQEQYVSITKVVLVIVVEVLIGHVAPASDSGNSIEDRSLVVHPLVDFAKARKCVLYSLPPTDTNREIRVVNTNLDVGVCGKQK